MRRRPGNDDWPIRRLREGERIALRAGTRHTDGRNTIDEQRRYLDRVQGPFETPPRRWQNPNRYLPCRKTGPHVGSQGWGRVPGLCMPRRQLWV